MLKDRIPPLEMVPAKQLTTLRLSEHPVDAETKLAPAGNVTVAMALVADCGPALLTLSV
jgi:hypothetical protein